MKQIKILSILLFMPATALVQSCEKVEDLLTFGFNIQDEFSLPPNIPINTPFTLPSVPMNYNSSQTFEDNNTRSDLVKKINLEYIKLTILEPVGQDFTFVKDIEIIFELDGVGEKIIAWKYDVEETVGQVLELDVTEDALDAYLKTDGAKMSIKVTTDKFTTKTVKISYDIRSRVTANVFE